MNVLDEPVTKNPSVTLDLTVAAGRLLINVFGLPLIILFGHGQHAPQQFEVMSPALAARLFSINVSGDAVITRPRGHG